MENEFEEYRGPVLTQEDFEEYHGPVTPARESTVSDKGRSYQQRELVGLPEPHEGMFEGMSREDAAAYESAYRNHPNSTSDWLGNITYNGKRVPSSLDTVMKGSLVDDIAGGLWTGVKEGAKMVGGVVDEMLVSEDELRGNTNNPHAARVEAAPPPRKGIAQTIEETIPDYNPDPESQNISGEIVQGAAETIPGMVAVGGPVNAISKLKTLPRLLKKALGGATLATGATATMDEDTSTMFTGEDAVIGEVWGGLARDPKTGTYSEQLFKKKLNLLMESYALAGVAEGAGKALAHGGRIAGNLTKQVYNLFWAPTTKAYQLDERTKGLVLKIADTLEQAPDNATPEQLAAIRTQLADDIKKMSEVDMNVKGMDQLPAGLQPPKTTRDTIGAYEASLEGRTLPKNRLSIDPATYKGPSTPAVRIGGQLFTGSRHSEAIEKAIQQFGPDSPQIKDFESLNDPMTEMGIFDPKRGGFRPGISGDDGEGVAKSLAKGKGKYVPEEPRFLPPNEKAAKIANARIIQQGARGLGLPHLEAKIGEPARNLERFANDVSQTHGGQFSVDEAGSAIQRSGEMDIAAGKQGVRDAEAEHAASVADRADFMRDDPIAQRTINEASTDYQFDVNKKVDETINSIRDEATDELVTRRKIKNEKYENIPSNARADKRAVSPFVDQYYDALSSKAQAELDDIMSGPGEGFNEGMDTADSEFIPWGKLKKFANTTLTKEINRLRSAQQFDLADELQTFKRHITDEQPALIKKSGGIGAKEAEEADEYFSKEFAPLGRQGVGEKLLDLEQKTRLKKDDFRVEGRKIVQGVLEDPKSVEYQLRLAETLEKRGKSDLIPDFHLGRIGAKVQDFLNKKGKLEQLDVDDFDAELKTLAPGIRDKPEVVERFKIFAQKLRDSTISIEDRLDMVKQAVKTAEDIEKNIKGDELKSFFSKDGKPVEEYQAAFEKELDEALKGEPSTLDKLKERLDLADDFTKDGLKSAYGEWIKKKMFSASEDASKGKKVNEGVFLKDKEKILRIGKRIFGDDDPVIALTERVWDEAGNKSLSQTQRALSIHDLSQEQKQLQGTLNKVFTFIWGGLSKAAHRARVLSGTAVNMAKTGEKSKLILDQLYSDPVYFSKVLKEAANSDKPKLTKQQRDILWKAFTRGTIYQGEDYDDTEAALNK